MIRPAQFNSYYLFIHLRIRIHVEMACPGESIFVHVVDIQQYNENHKKEHEPLTEMNSLQFLSQETNKQQHRIEYSPGFSKSGVLEWTI